MNMGYLLALVLFLACVLPVPGILAFYIYYYVTDKLKERRLKDVET
jgi:hypothetical protein